MTLESSAGAPRLHGLDAVRGGAFLLTVTFHATLSFLPGPRFWVTRDTPDMGIGAFFIVTHMSHMLLFFVLAGFFARMSVERRGIGAFARDRLLRVTLPAMVFWLPCMIGVIAAFITGAMVMQGAGITSVPPKDPPMSLWNFPLTHLWFLYALTLAYGAALVLAGLGRLIDRQGRLQSLVLDPVLRLLVRSRLLVPLAAAAMAPLFLANPGWLPATGIPTPDRGFAPNAIATCSYGFAFLLGWMLQRRSALLTTIRGDWLGYCVVASAASIALLTQIGPDQFLLPGSAQAHPEWLAGLYAIAAWSWTIGLIGAGLRFVDRANRAVRYVSDASYWIYIVHLPLVMALQVLVFRVQAPALVKFGLVSVASFLILFASYHLLVRHSWLGAWLNGRRVPWRKVVADKSMEVATA